jgi:LmbE family N-acetylglucosaminyl deacetylase
MDKPLRVLAIGAHPDDIEIRCGGTLAKYARAGHHVMMGYATNGDKGHTEIPPAELALIREKEARAAAAVIGAEVFWLGFPDGDLFYDRETRLVFLDMMRQARPDILFTHWELSYHPDHVACGQLAFGANYISSVPHIVTKHPATTTVASLYFMDVDYDALTEAALYVDVSEVYDLKRKMLDAHASQHEWVIKNHGVDLFGRMMERDRMIGARCGVEYAESFVPRGFRAPTDLLPARGWVA